MKVKFAFREKFYEKQHKENRTITQSEVARAVGVSREAVGLWMTTEARAVRFDTLEKLCDFFDCEPGDLIIRVPDESVGDLA
jgi:putative transcriptional regulator